MILVKIANPAGAVVDVKDPTDVFGQKLGTTVHASKLFTVVSNRL